MTTDDKTFPRAPEEFAVFQLAATKQRPSELCREARPAVDELI